MNVHRIILLGPCVLWLFISSAAYADVKVRLAPESASLFVYTPFTLHLDVESQAPPEEPDLPSVPDLAVTAVRRLPSEPARHQHGFQIEMIAERAGTLTLPPFAVQTEEGTASTPPVQLRIRQPRLATGMTLDVTIEPTSLRVGQPATVTVAWHSTVPFARCKQLRLDIPLLADERCQVFPLDPPDSDLDKVGLPVNGIRMVAEADFPLSSSSEHGMRRSLSFRYKLIPREPCVVQSRPARLLCALLPEGHEEGDSPGYFYNHFFEATTDSDSFEQIFLGVSVPKITVSDLPEKGRKAYFSGIVGPCRLRTSVVPTRMTLGQPALFTVHLDDVALGSQVAAVPSVAFGGFRSEFQLSQEPVRQNTTEHSRSFTYVLRPLNRRTTRIPAVVIQTFDPETDTFRTLRSGPIPIAVEGDEEAPLTLTSRIDAQTPAPLHGVRHNQVSECPMITIQNILEFLGRLWWVLVPLPPLLWVALRPTIRRWDRCRHDPVYALALTAWRRFRKTVWHDEEAAWRRYLAERLSLCADALTADSVTESLRRRNVDSNLIAETRDRFEQKDATEYGKRPPTPSKGTRGLARRLQKATTPLLLTSWLLIPLHAIAAESADTLFARAMRMRTEKPDEAHALFVESALSYESTGQFLNAGNSWFFAGENGRALGNYRAAQRRTPFDGQVRESIEFLRANRVDAFPSENTPEGRVAAVWNRYGTWRPSLRVGAFVVTYLAAWTLFLTAQLAGWRVRRSLWGVLLTAAMLPLASLIHSSFRQPEGVVIEDSVARLGPGYAYDPAFKQPIHKATEFAWLETREGWVHVRLPDTSEGWLLRSGCMLVE